MNQSYTFFYFDLKLKSPSDLALTEGLENNTEDTYEAAEFFNNRFQGIKKVTILEVQGIALRLMLVYERSTPDKITAKELTVFSRYLYNERNWDRFTKEDNKLFIPSKITSMEWHEAQSAVEGEFENNADEDKINRWPSLWPDWAQYDFYTDGIDERSNAMVSCEDDDADILTSEVSLSDQQLITVLNSILATQNLGSSESIERKKKTIQQIKKLIMPWAIH